jgi:hypothetical protein
VDTLAAFDALARGDRAEAARLRALALSHPAPPADARTIAAVRALNGPPFADGAGGEAPSGTDEGYPLDRLIAPIRGP